MPSYKHIFTGFSILMLGLHNNINGAAPVFEYGAGPFGASYTVNLTEPDTVVIASGDVTNADGTGIDLVKVNGGNDSSKFTLTYVDDESTYALAFNAAPDYESPGDIDANNTYEITLKATDKDAESSFVTFNVVIQNLVEDPVFTSTAAISRFEKTTSNASDTSTLTVTAVDETGVAITNFTVSGGNDQPFFDIDSSTGALTFKSAPDYDAPQDDGQNNVYDVDVQASDGIKTATQSIAITIVDVNEAPSITQPSSTAFNVQENWIDPVTYFDFSDPDFETIAAGQITYQITGDDQSQFNLDSSTGELTFLNPPSYEAPGDVDKNNTYEITATVRDSAGETGSSNLSITVINVNDAPTISIDSTSADITVAADSSVTVSGYETRTNGLPGFKFSSLTNSQITISDDDYSGSGLPQLLLWLKLDETAGSVVAVDSSGNGFNADLNGGNAATVWTSGNDAANGRDYSALDLNGTTDFLQITDAKAAALRPNEESYSIALWYKQDINNQNMVFFNKGTTISTTTTNGMLGYMTNNGYIIFRVSSSGSIAHAYKGPGLDTDWHHYVAVIDRAQKLLTVYIDEIAYVQKSGFSGSNVSDLATMGSINNTNSITIGSDGTSDFFDGILDDIRIYNGAITEKQVSELRSGGDPGQMQVTLEVGQGTLSLGDPATTGVTITTGDGADDTTIIFQGTYTAASNALDGLTYTPSESFNGIDNLSIQVDDQDNLNIGGAKKTTVSYSLNVQAINNPPVNNVPGSQSVNEGGSLAFSAVAGNGFSITDDASENPSATPGESDIEVTLTAQSGTGVLSLGTTTGLDFSGGVGNGTEDVIMTFKGTTENINTALDTLIFNLDGTGADADFNGIATVTIETNDMGNYGLDDLATPDPGKTTQQETDVDTVSISILSINDAPTITLADASIVENTTFVGQAIAADPDLNDTNSTESHNFSIFSGADMDFFEIDGAGNLSFKAAPSFETPQDDDSANTYNVTVRVTDSGGLTVDKAIIVTVTDANDAPTFTTTTTTHQAAENQTSVVVIAGADEDGQTVTYSISGGVDKDLFQIDAATGVLTFKTAPNYESSSAVSGLNDYLVEITLTDDNDPVATSTNPLALTIQVTDVNDSPVITTTAAIAVNEEKTAVATIAATDEDSGDTVTFSITGGADRDHFAIDSSSGALTFSSAPSFENPLDADTLNDYVVEVTATDSSNATATTEFTVSVTDINDFPKITNGSTAFTAVENQTTAAAITATDDDSTNVLAFTLVATADYALFDLITTSTDPASGAATLSFKAAPDFETPSDIGADNVYDVTLQISDGTETTTQSITITVTNENDPPVFDTFPNSQTVNEDEILTLNTLGNLINVSDPDVSDTGVDEIQVTLQVVDTNGVITLPDTTGISIPIGSNVSTSMTVQGNPQSINAVLNGMQFKATEHFNGAESINVTIDDMGNKDGDAQTLAQAFAITITPVNDPPANSLPVSQSTNEDVPLVLSQVAGNLISVSDPDSADGSQNLTVTLTVPDFDTSGAEDGTLTLASVANLTFDTSAGGGDGSVAASLLTMNGTIANINTALDGLTFAPASNFNGSTKITILSDDSALQDLDNLFITVDPLNDAPTITVPTAQTVNEDESLTFTTVANVAQVDTVTVTNGADGDVFTLSVDSNSIDFTFTGDAAQTATALSASVNAGSLNTLVTAADQGGGVVSLTAVNPGVPFTADLVVKTNTSGLANATILNTTANASDSTVAISDDASDDSSKVELNISSTNGLLILSSNTGLTFDEAQGGTQSASTTTGATGYVFTGTVANINAALQGLKYSPLANVNGNDTISLQVDDQGNYGTGSSNVVSASIAISITPINDGPSVTAPSVVQQINEDAPLTFNVANGNAISISDPDAAEVTGDLEATVSAQFGTLTLSTIANLVFTEGSGPTATMMKFTGKEADINTALNDLTYTPASDHNDNKGSEVITIQVSDQGNNGTTILTATATISVQVAALNDTPIIAFDNNSPSTNEDTELIFGAATNNAITVTDDATEISGSIQVTLTVLNGTLTLPTTDGLSFNGTNGAASFIFAGPTDKIATALDGMKYLPGAGSNGFGFNGTDTFTILAQDLGNTGTGGFLESTNSVSITVNAVNDAPVHLFNGSATPEGQSTPEDTALVFNTANANAITITEDALEDDTPVKITLAVDSGTLSLGDASKMDFTIVGSAGDGVDDATMTFAGKIGDVVDALEGLTFNPAANDSTDVTLSITTDDQGNTGTGSALSDTDTVSIIVTPVNDGPAIIFANATPSTSEDIPLLFNAEGNTLVTITDDASEDGSLVNLKLSVSSGTLTLSLSDADLVTNNIGILNGANGSSSMTIAGSVEKINLALNDLQYASPANYSGESTLTLVVDDQGNYGDGDALDATSTATITINPVNDAPVLSGTGDSFVNEDESLTLSVAKGSALSVSDVDTYSESSAIQATIKLVDDSDTGVVDRGSFTLGSTADLTFSAGTGTDDTAMIFIGSLLAVNAALDGLIYTPPADYNGEVYLKTTIDDQGNVGEGDALTNDSTSGNDEVKITVIAFNDGPAISLGMSALETNEDTPITFAAASSNGISVADVDYTETVDGLLLSTLSVTNGTLTLNPAADPANNFNFSIGDGTADAAMIFTGTAENINIALEGLVYTPNQDYNESDGVSTLTLTINDQGATGSGGVLTETKSIAITVKAQNDSPVIALGNEITIDEDNTFTLSTANGNAVSISDVDTHESANTLEVSITVASGTIDLPNKSGTLIFSVGDGNADTTMTFTGTNDVITTSLEGLVYAPTAHFNGTDSLVILAKDGGSQGEGGALESTSTMTVNVIAINDAPEIALPGNQIVNEDTPITFSSANGIGITTSDVDAPETDPGKVQLTLAVTNGTLTLATLQNLTVDAGADGSSTVTLTGTTTDLNAGLEGLLYTPSVDYNGSDALTLTLSDKGLTGAGGELQATGQISITLNSVNDAPVITLPTPPTIDEDTTQTFSTAATTLISIEDVDITDSILTLTLSVNDGTLKLASTDNIVFSSGADQSASMIIKGTLADINTALDGLVYTSDSQFNGTSIISLAANDGGAAGSGGVLETIETLEVTVTALNDAPVIILPDAPTIDEDTSVTFSMANNNSITITDDATEIAAEIQLSLTVLSGVLSLATSDNLTITEGEDKSSSMTLKGTATALTTALDGLKYTPDAETNSNTMGGAETLQFVADDLGGIGNGGTRTLSTELTITVNPINDAPIITAPSTTSTAEDTQLLFNLANSTLISFSDDGFEDGSTIQLQFSTSHGTLTLDTVAGVTIIAGDNATTTMTLTGNVLNLNNAIDGLAFMPDENYNGTTSLQVQVDDQGNAGDGVAMSDTKTVSITVDPHNDSPTISVPVAQETDEDTPVIFASAQSTAITVTDADVAEGSGDLQLALSVSYGTLTLASIDGITFTGGGDTTASMILKGIPSKLNTALEGLVYTPNTNINNDDILALTLSDLGDTGSGGEKTVSSTVSLPITSINDAPVNSLPTSQTVREDSILTFSTVNENLISISDDSPESSTSTEVQLSVTNGILTLASTTGLTVTAGADGSDALTFSGQLADINIALEGLTYTPITDYFGDDTLSIITNDNGGTGTGGALLDSDNLAITVQAVNDAPVNSIPVEQNTNEESALIFNATNENSISVYDDASKAGLAFNVTLEATGGVLELSTTDNLNLTGGTLNRSATIHFTGKMDDINAALNDMSFTPGTDFTENATITITTDDLGAKDDFDSGNLTDTDSFTITVNAVNDRPTLSYPTAILTSAEDATFTFASVQGYAVSVSDPDNYGVASTLKLTLSVDNGTLTLSDTSGLISGSNGSDSMIILGTPDNLNAALEGLVLTPTNDFIGTTNISISVDDQGNTGSGGPLTDSGSVQVYHAPTNDAPVITLPSPLTINEDGELLLSGGVIQVQDDAEAADLLKIEVATTNGTTNLGESIDVIVTQDGSSGTLAFSGTISQINDAFNMLTFIPTKDFVGDATIAIAADDQGAGGQGGAMIGSNTLSIAVAGVNDAPTLNIPDVQVVDFDGSKTFSTATDNAITFTDVDAGDSDLLEISLEVAEGTLTLPSTDVIKLVTGDGENDSTLVFTATATNCLLALDGLTYTPIQSPGPSTQILIAIDDLGNSGSGGARNVAGTLDISINYKPPEITQGESVSVEMEEDNSSSWIAPTLTAIDPNSETLTWSLHGQPVNGVVEVSGTGTQPSFFTYTPNIDFHGQDDFSIKVTDTSGHFDTVSVQVTVIPTNDAPVFTSTNDSGTYTLDYYYQISASDIDGDALTYNVVDLPSWLSLEANEDGTASLSGLTSPTSSKLLWADAKEIPDSEGWKHSEWFGVFQEIDSNWIFHAGLGWVYFAEKNPASLWIWTERLGWCWTSAIEYHNVTIEVSDSVAKATQTFSIEVGTFPRLFSHDAGAWLHYEKDSAPARFYNHLTGNWIGSVYSFALNVTKSDEAGGSIKGGGTYEFGATATLIATPQLGYKFTRWTDGDGDEISTDTTYQFVVSSDANIQANFIIPLSVVVTLSDPDGGSIKGGGTYEFGATATLIATPQLGYKFTRWTDGDGDEISTDTTYQFVVSSNTNVQANFSIDIDYLINNSN